MRILRLYFVTLLGGGAKAKTCFVLKVPNLENKVKNCEMLTSSDEI